MMATKLIIVVFFCVGVCGCVEETSEIKGEDASLECERDIDCAVGYKCREGICVKKEEDKIGVFPASLTFVLETDYPEIAQPEYNYTENYGEVTLKIVGGSVEGTRKVGIREGSIEVKLHEDGLELRSFNINFQNVHISRESVPPSGLWVGDIRVEGWGEKGEYSLFSEDELTATVYLNALVRLKFGTDEDPENWVELAEPFEITDFQCSVKITALTESHKLNITAMSESTTTPVFKLEETLEAYFRSLDISASIPRE